MAFDAKQTHDVDLYSVLIASEYQDSGCFISACPTSLVDCYNGTVGKNKVAFSLGSGGGGGGLPQRGAVAYEGSPRFPNPKNKGVTIVTLFC